MYQGDVCVITSVAHEAWGGTLKYAVPPTGRWFVTLMDKESFDKLDKIEAITLSQKPLLWENIEDECLFLNAAAYITEIGEKCGIERE